MTQTGCAGEATTRWASLEAAEVLAALAAANARILDLQAQLRVLNDRNDTLWENPQAWMKWCDLRVLERCEAAEAQLREARLVLERFRVEEKRVPWYAHIAGQLEAALRGRGEGGVGQDGGIARAALHADGCP